MDKYRLDSQKLSLHPQRVAQWLSANGNWDAAKKVYPLYVELSPVGACNHRCTFCAVDYRGYRPILWPEYPMMSVLNEMGRLGVKSVMFGGEGEPLIHKCIDSFVDAARFAGMDVAFTTNATLLHKLDGVAKCTWIKASVNAGTLETYIKVHNAKEGDWDRLWKNLADAVKRKADCTIGVQMVLLPENEHEIPELEKRCNDAGVDYLVVKPYSQHSMSVTHKYETWKPGPLPSSSGKTIIRREAFAAQESDYSKCNATPNFWAFLTCEGDICTCSAYLGDPRFMIGNVLTQSFREIWEGERRRENLELVRNHLSIHECRVNCRMHEANIYLNDLTNPPPHASFI